jgi:hypothetical protein
MELCVVEDIQIKQSTTLVFQQVGLDQHSWAFVF